MSPQAGNVFAEGVVDRGPWFFYDRATAAASTTTALSFQMFGLKNATTKDATNMQQANRLPPPQAFALSSIGFVFATTMLFADLAAFLKAYYFEFKIGIKVFAEGPLHLWPGGAGIAGFAATNHATTSMLQVVNNGNTDLGACRRFPDYPRIIPANVFVGLNILAGSAGVALAATVAATIVSPAYGGLDVLAVIDGVYDREVQ